jgi:hypothetical protein
MKRNGLWMIAQEDQEWESHLRDACATMGVREGVFEFLLGNVEYDGRDWLLGVLCRLYRHQPNVVANANLNWWRATMHAQNQRRAWRTNVRREQEAMAGRRRTRPDPRDGAVPTDPEPLL